MRFESSPGSLPPERRPCTLRIHPNDAAELGINDRDPVVVGTEAGSAQIEAEVTDSSHPGQVIIPHGFGLVHGGESHGVNVNQLAPAKHRDRLQAPRSTAIFHAGSPEGGRV
jgi:anaerobic selenocysteine-containing dehydrogenase